MKRILFGLSIVLLCSGIIFAQGLGTLRDNTKVTKTEFQDTTTYIQAEIGTIISSTLTPRIPTVYVCASDSPPELKAIANYVCTGSSDEITITQALASITKGTIRLSGNFNVSAPVYVNKDSITICGEDGWGAKIAITNYATFGSFDGIFQTTMSVKCLNINNIWFEGGLYKSNYGVAFSNEGTIDTLNIYNCYFSNFKGYVITSDTGKTITNAWIKNNFFNRFGGFSILLADHVSYVTVDNNYFYDNAVGIGFLRFSNASNFTVSNNYMYNSNAGAGVNTTGVEFDSCSYGRIIHNTFDHSGNLDTSGNGNHITIEDNTFLSCGASSAFYGAAIGYYGGVNSYISIINNKITGSVNYDGIFFYTTGSDNIISENIVNDRVGGNVGIHVGSIQPIIVSNNICNGNSYGFNISSVALITENYSTSAIADAVIAITSGKDNNNSWNTNNITAGGEVPMSAPFDMGNNNINNCPVIMTSTNDVAGLKISTSGLQGQVDLKETIDNVQLTRNVTGQISTAVSTTAVMALSISTSGVRTGVDGDILATTGKIDVDTKEYDLTFDTYTLSMPIALSSWTETSDFGEYPTRSTFTIIDLVFVAKTSAPISAMTFDCKCYDTSVDIMNGSLSLSAGARQSAVFTSTNTIPMDCGLKLSVVSGRCNAPVYAVFRVYKRKGQ